MDYKGCSGTTSDLTGMRCVGGCMDAATDLQTRLHAGEQALCAVHEQLPMLVLPRVYGSHQMLQLLLVSGPHRCKGLWRVIHTRVAVQHLRQLMLCAHHLFTPPASHAHTTQHSTRATLDSNPHSKGSTRQRHVSGSDAGTGSVRHHVAIGCVPDRHASDTLSFVDARFFAYNANLNNVPGPTGTALAGETPHGPCER